MVSAFCWRRCGRRGRNARRRRCEKSSAASEPRNGSRRNGRIGICDNRRARSASKGYRQPLLALRAPSKGPVMARTLPELQRLIREVYGAKDSARGLEGTFMWFMQEVGELATALRGGDAEE